MPMKHKVLVVDDERLVRWSVGKALSESHYEVELASSGEEAVEKAKNIKFDMVVSDLKMDGINGVETVRQIRKVIPEVKAVVITAYGTEKDAWEARNEGISLWMAKPFRMQELLRFIDSLLTTVDVMDTSPNPINNHSNNQGRHLISLLTVFLFTLISLITSGYGNASNTSDTSSRYNVNYLYDIKDMGTRFNKLRTPSHLIFSQQFNEFYFINKGNDRILAFDTNGMILHQWQNFGKLKHPVSMAFDSKGKMYIADVDEPIIAVLNYFGQIINYINLTGITTTEPAEFRVQKLLIDKSDRLYIGENKGNRILVIDLLTEKLVQEIGGMDSKENSIQSFTDMVFDDKGNLIILDGGQNQIMVLNKEGVLIRAFGKSGGGPYTHGMASGLAYDPVRKWTFVTDATRHCVLVYDENGECFYEFGGLGLQNNWFYFPRGIAIDNHQIIYVLEPNVGRIQVYEMDINKSNEEVKL